MRNSKPFLCSVRSPYQQLLSSSWEQFPPKSSSCCVSSSFLLHFCFIFAHNVGSLHFVVAAPSRDLSLQDFPNSTVLLLILSVRYIWLLLCRRETFPVDFVGLLHSFCCCTVARLPRLTKQHRVAVDCIHFVGSFHFFCCRAVATTFKTPGTVPTCC